MALNVLLDKFHESVTSKEYMIDLFMDLRRAFDTIYHTIYYKTNYVNMASEDCPMIG